MDKSIASGKELDFYLSYVMDKNMKVLEPMCGNGRMLIPFMEKGIDIEGFDLSESMLELCIEKAEKLNLTPRVWNQKIEEFKSENQFDLIMIPVGSFSLLPDHLVDASLANMRSVLKDNGKFVLTIMVKDESIDEIQEWTQTIKETFVEETIIGYKKVKYDEENNILDMKLKYELYKDHQLLHTELMDFPIRMYELDEFKGILSRNGFQNIQIHEVKDGYGEGKTFYVYECMK